MKKREDVKRKALLILGIVFIILGIIYVFHAVKSITGFIVVDHLDQKTSGIVGLWFLSVGMFFVSLSKKKKGQAAMEFLFTYGWAIMASITAIGVLVYMGVFGGNFLGSSTTAILSAPFSVQAAAISVGGSSIQLEIGNSGEQKTITSVVMGTCLYTGSQTVGENAAVTITLVCSPALSGNVKGDLIVRWSKPGNSLTQSSTGTFSGKASSSGEQQAQGGGDSDPPAQSGWSPAPGSDVASNFDLTFNLDENGDCKYEIDNDVGYSIATNDCTGDGTTEIICPVSGISGNIIAYISCKDSTGNEDNSNTNTALNYQFTGEGDS